MEKITADNKDLIIEPIGEQRLDDASAMARAIELAMAAYLAAFRAEQLPVIS